MKFIWRLFRRPEFWIVLFLLLFTLVNRWPLLSHLGTHTYYTAYDYCIYNWELLWNCHKLETLDFAGYWASNGMYPYPYAFAFSENMIGLTPFAFPIWLISRNPILTINLLQLLLMWLTAVATFFVIRKMIGGSLPALAGALIFSFYPYLSWSFTIGHPHILAMMWIPLIVFANWKYWQNGKSRYLFGIFFFWLWTFLISIYLGIFLTVFMVLWNAIWFLHERQLFTLKKIGRWCAVVFVAWALLIPVFLVYQNVAQDMGVVRTLEQQMQFTGNIWSWFSIPPDNWLWGQNLKILPPSRLMSYEDAMFPGLITIVLFILSFFIKGMPKWLKSLRWSALFMAVFALGPFALGIRWKLPLPFILLYYSFPPLWATRNPHRWGLFTVLIIGFLAAYLLKRLPAKPRYTLLTILVIAGIALEAWTFIKPYEAMHPGNTAVYQNLAEKDGKHVIAELPMTKAWGQWGWETRSLLGSTYHWQTIINGITGLWPAVQYQLGQELREFPSPHTIAMLQALDVDRIVLNEHKLRRKFSELLPLIKTTKEMRFRKRFNASSIWSLKKGETRAMLEPDNDFIISSPSILLSGRATLSIAIPLAEKRMIFNPKAPAQWKFPIARPWVIREKSAGKMEPFQTFDWIAPGLFHSRNSRFPVTMAIQPDQKSVELEIDIMGKKVALRKNITVLPAQKSSAALPPFLLLPQGFSEIPYEKLRAGIAVNIPETFQAKAGETMDFSVQITNPGPYYWPADKNNGICLALTLTTDGVATVFDFPLDHDLFPGDCSIQYLHVFIPYGSTVNQLEINCFGRGPDLKRVWFPEVNSLLLWPPAKEIKR
jgi:hypothetical protein